MYSQEVYLKAAAVLEDRKRSARLVAAARKEEIYASLPEVRQIDDALRSGAVSMTKLALGGRADLGVTIGSLREHSESLLAQRGRMLMSAGYPADYTDILPDCPICDDTGRKPDGSLCSCYKELCRGEALKELDANSGAADCSFENFSLEYYPRTKGPEGVNAFSKMCRVFENCVHYAENFTTDSPSVLMSGKTGLGKTHLSLSIAKLVIARGYGVVYQSAQTMFSRLEKERFSRDGSGEPCLENLLGCDLLIVDDLGAEFATSFTVAAVGNLVNARLVEHRPTIINTNCDENDLMRLYGERTASRLLGEYAKLFFYGCDIRQLK